MAASGKGCHELAKNFNIWKTHNSDILKRKAENVNEDISLVTHFRSFIWILICFIKLQMHVNFTKDIARTSYMIVQSLA